jgi:6-phosphogluconolactonase
MKRINFIVLAALAFSWALLAAPLPAQFVYVANVGDSISAYNLNPKTGVLTALSGSPFATGAPPFFLALHPSNRFLYATNRSGTNTVSGYSIDCDGYLSPVSGSPFPTGQGPIAIAITRQ